VSGPYGIAAWALRLLEPEAAHELTLAALRAGLGPRAPAAADPILATRLAGLSLSNPLGLAAGFDKNAQVFAPMLRAGFGFVECGTTTPRPQNGNPRPRLFRLAEDRAVINRLGFNNAGVAAFARAMARGPTGGVVGANIGPNRHAASRVGDYLESMGRLWGLADYFTINVSSPNTAALRELQHGAALDELLAAVEQDRAARADRPPFFLKIAPDLSEADIGTVVETAVRRGFDGLVLTNTTVARPATLRSAHKAQAGGLSGVPLMGPSTDVLRIARQAAGGRLALIGVGGVASGADAYAKIRAGASAVQLYTALIYQGPALVGAILADLAAFLRADGFASLGEAVGAR
jgi:dihydroorotate dehydrogenase